MKLWKNFLGWIRNNKDDIFAIFVISFIVTAILCSYTFNTIAPQEGWYSIYARNILQDGLVPYRDFPLVVPPLFLYIWTVWQVVFGDNFIVFHYLNIVLQISFAVAFYFLFRQVFNRKIAVIMTLIFTSIRIFAEWDNGVASYNTLAFIFMAIMALITIKQVNFINTCKKINLKLLWTLGLIYALSFFNKQTSGAFTIMASCFTLIVVSFKVLGVRQTIKHLVCLFLISILFLLVLLLPILVTGAFPAMINNIFANTSKGSVLILLIKLLYLPFPKDLWLYYIIVMVICLVFLPKLKFIKWDRNEDSGSFRQFVLIFILVCTIIFLLANNISFTNYLWFYKLRLYYGKFLYVSYHLSFLFAVILFCFLLFVWLRKNISNNRLNLLIIILFFVFENIAELLSNGLHYPQFVSLCIGLLLLWKWKKFNNVKNIFMYIGIGIFFFISYAYKLYIPMQFWGWKSGSIFNKLDKSYVPKLKGMKIPVEEKQLYEQVYDVVHKYTDKDDKILAFNNNQIFYDLTERKPYTQYISLYHDVSPDNQPLEILEKMRTDLPKVIIFLRLSDEIEQFHENLYRGYISGQRLLRDYIDSLIEEGKYIPVNEYKQTKFLDVSSFPKELMSVYNEINKNSSEAQKQDFLNRIVPYIKTRNSFLQNGCTLQILVRYDLVQDKE